MFKKLKDKLAEEVKSSPQRIQQFAQAAQAAVTSASSSISDITNSDLFSIGDNDTQQPNRPTKVLPGEQKRSFQDVSLIPHTSPQAGTDSMDFLSNQDLNESQRQRRLSNSSLASDVSFRLPSYESPSMYHLQSDVEISASEAEERGFSGGNVSLDRVTKEQIYAAYRRTQERYSKYRTQYADLARHYKLLERENAKARSVLVETQDKALRRISELREQCSLEQSAKAHLEKALRVELEEKNIKIDTLDTKIKLLQNHDGNVAENNDTMISNNTNNVQLISFDTENNQTVDESSSSETNTLNNKIEKLEILVNKYKESLKSTKEKNGQLNTELQILTSELENKNKEIEELQETAKQIDQTKEKIQELNDLNEQLQNKVNAFDFNKNKTITTLELDLQKSQEEIEQLKSKIKVFTKREEEYAISLAENKLSIHKELESKETEIKSLKDRLAESKQEVQSLNIVITDYKNNITSLEEENLKLKNDLSELNSAKAKIHDLESLLQSLNQKYQVLENVNAKADEEYKCLQLQLKQETAEKLAMIDRNVYLEERNTQLTEDNAKKTLQLNSLGNELLLLKKENNEDNISEKVKMMEEIDMWKNKYSGLETEIQEEREELIKLQSEIEKLLANYELIQLQNSKLNKQVNELEVDNNMLKDKHTNITHKFKTTTATLLRITQEIKNSLSLTAEQSKLWKKQNDDEISDLKENMNNILQKLPQPDTVSRLQTNYEEYKQLYSDSVVELNKISEAFQNLSEEFSLLKEENILLKSEMDTKSLHKNDIDAKIQNVNAEYNQAMNDLITLEHEHQELQRKFAEGEVNYRELQQTMSEKVCSLESEIVVKNTEIKDFKEIEHATILEMNALKQEYNDLINKIDNAKENELNIQQLNQNIIELTQINNTLKNESEVITNTLKEENEILLNKLKDAEEKHITIEQLQQHIKLLTQENKTFRDESLEITSAMKDENELLINKLQDAEEKQSLIEQLQHDIKDMTTEKLSLKNENECISNALKQENEILSKKLKDVEHEHILIEQLQQHVKDLTRENDSLKNQYDGITKNIEELQLELSDVRKSHTLIEIEKDRLTNVIEKLERKERETAYLEKDTQTIDAKENSNIDVCETVQKIELSDLSQTNDQREKYNEESDLLKEENKRLQSDIVGLQTYLAKISKENSILNDKLRELIASSDNSPEKNEIMIQILSERKTEVQSGKEKLNDLIRENTLLVEENLELKDQLNTQNCINPVESTKINKKDTEYLTLQEEYKDLMDHNSKLEQRICDLEQMNKSVSGNIQQVQEKNEKLRLSNEKLERRLDEALVSLRHLHSLQENTELEYLRNILYEYLTGTGAHSVTLTKVLAAVVKFDDSQTKQVLQKEKERQGLLRQLGLL